MEKKDKIKSILLVKIKTELMPFNYLKNCRLFKIKFENYVNSERK